jgi:hypothetical protein
MFALSLNLVFINMELKFRLFGEKVEKDFELENP